MKPADQFERQLGLRREGGRLVDPRPENPVEVVGGELSPWALKAAARSRAEAAIRDYVNVGASRLECWALVAGLGES